MSLTATERLIDAMNRTGNTESPVTRKIRCENCIHCNWKPFNPCVCKALPPSLTDNEGRYRWPKVEMEIDWCGMFKSRLEQVGETTDKNSSETVLKYALEKINDGIVKDGNSARTSLTLFEIKAIVETALASVGSSQKEKQ